MRLFDCPVCGGLLFFDNDRCLACGTDLVFDFGERRFLACADDAPPCRNREIGGCSWKAGPDGYCEACAFNRTVSDLSNPASQANWRVLEGAKRRALFQLGRLRHWPVGRTVETSRGLAIDFLQSAPDGPPVLTGHADGVITLDLDEGDAARREATRSQLGERFRTPLGHFRHEFGHFFWMHWSLDDGFLKRFREVFGDERVDYAAALETHYANGPRKDWELAYISPYAAVHPWEDWAESWAHLMHLLATMESAVAVGLGFPNARHRFFQSHEAPFDPYAAAPADFSKLLETWYRLSCATNLLNRSVGQPDLYPFALNEIVGQKLAFIFTELHR